MINLIFETVKSEVVISLFKKVRLSVSISPKNLYNSLKSIKQRVLSLRNRNLKKTSCVTFNIQTLFAKFLYFNAEAKLPSK